jgi:TIR domain
VETALSAFLSHSNLDESQVKLVQRFLTEIGIKPWASFDDIHNSDYDKLIARKIKSKDIFLLILSNNSANSKNVQNECAFADANNKIIIIYELETTDIPEGLALRLGRKQRILAYKFSDDSLERLARLIIQESGLDWLAYSTKARDAESKIKRQQLELEQQYQRNLDNYKEDYWNCRTRSGKYRADAEIVVIDRERLSRKKVDFGLTDNAISKIQADFDRRRKRDFTFVLSNALAMKMLTVEDLQTLERKRLDCCVSQSEVAVIITSRKNIPPLQLESGSILQIDQPLMIPIDVTWIKDLFEQRREKLYKTKTTVSKDKTETPVPRCRKVDDPLNAVVSKTDSTILEQDNIYRASMDSILDCGTSPSKRRFRRFFNCNDHFLIVSEVFLGNEIKRVDVTHIERNDNSIVFSGKRIPGVTYSQYSEIRATRKFSEIIIQIIQ